MVDLGTYVVILSIGFVILLILYIRTVIKLKDVHHDEQYFRFMLDKSSDIIYRLECFPEPKFIYLSSAVKQIMGYNPKEHYIEPEIAFRMIHPDDYEKVEKIVNGDFNWDEVITFRWINKHGETIWLEQHLTPYFDEEDNYKGVNGVARDVTERKLLEERLTYLSFHDSLTGLYNRTYFDQQIEEFKKSKASVGVMIIDLDGLKQVNDHLGHTKGDQYIQRASKVLKDTLPKNVILCRHGGDEFIALFPQFSQKQLEEYDERLKRKLHEYNKQQKGLPLQFSIGYAITSEDQSIEETIQYADFLMYKQKDLNKI